MTAPKLSPKMSPSALAHAQRYLESGGTEGHLWRVKDAPEPLPCLLLTTRGRKSGEHFANPLIYGRDGDNFIICASRGGGPDHPNWYKNIVADPAVEFQVATVKYSGRARTATGEERARLWKMMTGVFPSYDSYQIRAGAREIPVIVLEPTKS